MDTYKVTAKFIIGLSLAFTFCQCTNANSDLQKLSLTELLREGVESFEGDSYTDICYLMNDSLSKMESADFMILPYIDYVDEVIDWGFAELPELPLGVPDYLILDVMIQGNNIFVNGENIVLSELQNYASSSIFPIDVSEKPEIENRGVFLNVCISREFGLSIGEWNVTYGCLKAIMNVYDMKRNSLAIEKWGNKFDVLDFNQQTTLIDIIGYPIIFSFNKNCG